MAKILGNRNASIRGAGINGIGTAISGPTQTSWVTVVGEAGETICLPWYQVVPNKVDFNISIQTSVSVDIQYTLGQPSAITNDGNTLVLWSPVESLAALEIHKACEGIPFTGVKLKFTSAGSVTFYAR